MKDSLLSALLLVLFLLALFCLPSPAQDAPLLRPVPKTYWAETAAFTVSNVLDGYTTVMEQERYRTRVHEKSFIEGGSSWLLGRHPGALRYGLGMGGLQAVSQLAAYRLERSPRRWQRWTGHALMAYGTQAHVTGAVNNYQVLGRLEEKP